MRYGNQGPDVQEMQENLIDHGYQLPKHGADGDFGDETLEALNDFEKKHHWPITTKKNEVDKKTLEDLDWDQPKDPDIPEIPTPDFPGIKLFDLRASAWNERNPKKFKRSSNGKPIIRNPSSITGITIHQTAVKYDVAQYQIQAAKGDRNLALARRSLRVACHVMAFHDGFIAWPNDLRWYVYHGNGFNSFELGLEIDGNYPGLIGGKTWNGKKPTKATISLIVAAKAAIELLVIEGRKIGMPIEYIHAHRQSSRTRRDDPGEELWKKVVLDYAVPTLGLKTEPTRTLKDGRQIPIEWDTSGLVHY